LATPTTAPINIGYPENLTLYEALRECINMEIGWHNSAINRINDKNSIASQRHDKAIDSLIEARTLLRPDDSKMLHLADLLITGMCRSFTYQSMEKGTYA
jgi:hypothetical protein